MRRLWLFCVPYRRRWFWGIAMLVLTNVASMTIPQIIRTTINGLTLGVDYRELRTIALVLVVVACAGAVFRTLSRIHIFFAARDAEKDIRCAFYAQLCTLDKMYFANKTVGDLMSRATNDLSQIRLLLGAGLLNLINTAVAYAVALPLMLAISPKLTLQSLLILPPSILLMRFLTQHLYRRNQEQQESMARLSSYVQETLQGLPLLRAFHRENYASEQFRQHTENYYRTSVRLARFRSATMGLALTLANVGIFLAVFSGSYDSVTRGFPPGDVVAIIEYMALLAWPTFGLGWVLSIWQRGRASMHRLNEVLTAESTIPSGSQMPPQISPTLRVEKLSLSIENRLVLDSVSFSVPQGTTTAIVGEIGSGKSTFVNVLCRLHPVASGHVYFGNFDICDLDTHYLHAQMAVVPQINTLFSATLFANVAWGKPESTEQEVLNALSNAQFSKDLQQMPQGLQTLIGERGLNLSGGQKQRVALARALLLNPKILILDDTFSAVDTETEAALVAMLKKRRAQQTTLIVSHRLAAVTQADQIIVLDKGRVAERGRHAQLLDQSGLYKTMWFAQHAEAQTEDVSTTPLFVQTSNP